MDAQFYLPFPVRLLKKYGEAMYAIRYLPEFGRDAPGYPKPWNAVALPYLRIATATLCDWLDEHPGTLSSRRVLDLRSAARGSDLPVIVKILRQLADEIPVSSSEPLIGPFMARLCCSAWMRCAAASLDHDGTDEHAFRWGNCSVDEATDAGLWALAQGGQDTGPLVEVAIPLLRRRVYRPEWIFCGINEGNDEQWVQHRTLEWLCVNRPDDVRAMLCRLVAEYNEEVLRRRGAADEESHQGGPA